MGFTPEQIKGRIKSVAKQNNADARTLMRIYMMERFLERLAQSEYRDNFIIKGGILVTAMIGVAHRSTMDIDTSMKNLNLSAEDSLCGAVSFYKRCPAAICESNFQEEIPCRAFQGIGCLCRICEIFPGRERWKAAIAEIFEKTERRTDQRNRGEEKGIRSLKGRIPAFGNCIG